MAKLWHSNLFLRLIVVKQLKLLLKFENCYIFSQKASYLGSWKFLSVNFANSEVVIVWPAKYFSIWPQTLMTKAMESVTCKKTSKRARKNIPGRFFKMRWCCCFRFDMFPNVLKTESNPALSFECQNKLKEDFNDPSSSTPSFWKVDH